MKWLILFLVLVLGYQYGYRALLYRVPDYDFVDTYNKKHNLTKISGPKIVIFIDSRHKESLHSMSLLNRINDKYLANVLVYVFNVVEISDNDFYRFEKQYPSKFIFFKAFNLELRDIFKKYFSLRNLGDIFVLGNKTVHKVSLKKLSDKMFEKELISKIKNLK